MTIEYGKGGASFTAAPYHHYSALDNLRNYIGYIKINRNYKSLSNLSDIEVIITI